MKILVIRLLSIMASAYSSQNFSVIAYGLENQSSITDFAKYSEKIKLIPAKVRERKSVFDWIKETIELSTLIRIEKPDVIHVNALKDLLPVFIASRLFRTQIPKPLIIGMSHSPNTWNNLIKSWISAKYINFFADGFVCLATSHKNQLLSMGISEEQLIVIPNPYENVLDGLEYIITNNTDIRITYVASICLRKGQDILIRAASKVLQKYPNVSFDLIGTLLNGEEKYYNYLNTLVGEFDISNRVHFIGSVPHIDIIKKLQESNIIVFPSRSEMMPRAVIESMVAGKPVIASAVDGILDLIENGKTGVLVKPGDENELAVAICELIECPEQREKIGLAGQSFVLDYCSPNRVGRLYQDFCISLSKSFP